LIYVVVIDVDVDVNAIGMECWSMLRRDSGEKGLNIGKDETWSVFHKSLGYI
jgi:hypothetical protein